MLQNDALYFQEDVVQMFEAAEMYPEVGKRLQKETPMKYQIIYLTLRNCSRRDLLCNRRNGDFFTCEDNTFSHKAHLVFHWY